ncbi:MAG: universal stress protein [Pseudomonadota bacterium]
MYNRVLIPVDVTVPDEAVDLLKKAQAISAAWGAEYHVVTVIPDVGMAIVGSFFNESFEAQSRAEARKALNNAIAAAGVEATAHILMGGVYDEVIKLAEKIEADMIIVGAHQPEQADYLLGSTAARIVRHSEASVLVVRAS